MIEIMNVWKLGIDAPLNSLRDPQGGLRVKQRKKKKIKARSIARNTSRVGGCVGTLGWD